MEKLSVLIDFRDPSEAARWRSVDDEVMGGRSASRVESTEAGCAFAGVVSLEDGGGFASARAPVPPAARGALARAGALVLRFRGDGCAYKLRLRAGGRDYQARFETEADTWSERAFPLAAFEPVRRGRALSGVEALDPARVDSVGLLISERQAGPFRLELATLAVG